MGLVLSFSIGESQIPQEDKNYYNDYISLPQDLKVPEAALTKTNIFILVPKEHQNEETKSFLKDLTLFDKAGLIDFANFDIRIINVERDSSQKVCKVYGFEVGDRIFPASFRYDPFYIIVEKDSRYLEIKKRRVPQDVPSVLVAGAIYSEEEIPPKERGTTDWELYQSSSLFFSLILNSNDLASKIQIAGLQEDIGDKDEEISKLREQLSKVNPGGTSEIKSDGDSFLGLTVGGGLLFNQGFMKDERFDLSISNFNLGLTYLHYPSSEKDWIGYKFSGEYSQQTIGLSMNNPGTPLVDTVRQVDDPVWGEYTRIAYGDSLEEEVNLKQISFGAGLSFRSVFEKDKISMGFFAFNIGLNFNAVIEATYQAVEGTGNVEAFFPDDQITLPGPINPEERNYSMLNSSQDLATKSAFLGGFVDLNLGVNPMALATGEESRLFLVLGITGQVTGNMLKPRDRVGLADSPDQYNSLLYRNRNLVLNGISIKAGLLIQL